MKPIVTQFIAEYLGAPDDDLLTAVLDHLRARKGAAALVQELEPVRTSDFGRGVMADLSVISGAGRGGNRFRAQGVVRIALRDCARS